MKKIQNYIGGEWAAPQSGNYLNNEDPSKGEVYSLIPDSDEKDVELAYKAAKEAFPTWSKTTVEERSNWLSKIAKAIDARLEELAQAESIDNGKPISLARNVDIPRASSNFDFFAKAISQLGSEAYETVGKNSINYVLRQPLGVVGCISPWNLPLYLFSWKIAPALAAGNCVVAKPSEVTPMTAYLLSEICKEINFPKGVLNIVHGVGGKVGQAVVEHPDIKAISFTGGTKTGESIARTAAPMFKKLSLELGGKNPNVIFSDCEYDKMLNTTVRSSFSNQGQICLCGSRILVEKSIFDTFKKDFVSKVQSLNIGPPLEESTEIGALVSKQHFEKVQSYIQLAQEEGGKLLCGGKPITLKGFEKGYYLEPTVIELEDENCRANQEEIFGPVVTLMTFETEQEAIEKANSTKYGLSCTIWTENINKAMRVSEEIEAGIVWINTWMNRDLRTPFGGVKNSGVGREGGFDALKFFTEPKNVCIEYTSNKKI